MNTYGIPIEETEFFSPPDIRASFYLSKPLTEEQEKKIEKLICGWFDVGLNKGFDDYGLSYFDDLIFDEENVIYVSVDFGNATDRPLEVLIKILKTALEDYGVKITKIELE